MPNRKNVSRRNRKNRKNATRRQRGGLFGLKNPFAKKVAPAPAPSTAAAPAAPGANKMAAARAYVNAGLAKGQTGYQISSNAYENSPPGVSFLNVNSVLKEKGLETRSR